MHQTARAAPWVSFAVTAALFGCGPVPLEPREPTPGVPHFKVATYNVLSLMAHDSETIATVGATDAEIICLQEVDSAWRDVLRETYSATYPFMLFKEHSGASGLAVLSKYPLSGSDLLMFRGFHPAWHVNALTPAGRLQLLIVHLRADFSDYDNPVEAYLKNDTDRLQETKSFIERSVEGAPTIVLGDFNEGVNADSVEYLESLGYQNALPLFHPGQFTWRQRSIGDQLNMTIDHILFDNYFEPLNAYVLVRGNSDHIPVIAHLEVSGPWPELSFSAQASEALPAQ